MNQHYIADSHNQWLDDIEYRREFGAESAKLEVAAALADARDVARITQAGLRFHHVFGRHLAAATGAFFRC